MGLRQSGRSLAAFLAGGGPSGSTSSPAKYGATAYSPSLVPDPNPKVAQHYRPMSRPSSPLIGSARSPRQERVRAYDWHDYGMGGGEDGEEVLDDDVEQLIDVPYPTLIRNYALVPIASLVFLCALIALFTFCWAPSSSDPSRPPQVSYPYPPHLPELLVGAAAWIVSYSLRVPSFLVTSSCLGFPLWLSTLLHVALEEALRWATLCLLGIRLNDCNCEEEESGKAVVGEDWTIPGPSTQDDAFRRVFWIAVGWALVEVCWSVSQGYEQLALYRDVLPSAPSSHPLLPRWLSTIQQPPSVRSNLSSNNSPSEEIESISHRFVHNAITPDEAPTNQTVAYMEAGRASPTPGSKSRTTLQPKQPVPALPTKMADDGYKYAVGRLPVNGVIENVGGVSHGSGVSPTERKLDEEMQQLINIQSRTELEMVFGVPPPNIPVFISILQRLDSILLTIGLTLLLSSTFLSNLARSLASPPNPQRPDLILTDAAFRTIPAFSVLVLLHTGLSIMWTELLPRIGVHTASYVGLMVSLGVFFGGLAAWGALI